MSSVPVSPIGPEAESKLCDATKQVAGAGTEGKSFNARCEREAGHDGDHWNGSLDLDWPASIGHEGFVTRCKATGKVCKVCGDDDPFHVHNGDERIAEYFTIGRGMTDIAAAREWQRRAVERGRALEVERRRTASVEAVLAAYAKLARAAYGVDEGKIDPETALLAVTVDIGAMIGRGDYETALRCARDVTFGEARELETALASLDAGEPEPKPNCGNLTDPVVAPSPVGEREPRDDMTGKDVFDWLADELVEVSEECLRSPGTKPLLSLADRMWQGEIPEHVLDAAQAVAAPVPVEGEREPEQSLADTEAELHIEGKELAADKPSLTDRLVQRFSKGDREKQRSEMLNTYAPATVMPDTPGPIDRAPCPRCNGGGCVNDRGTAPDPASSPTGIDPAVSECPDCHGTGKLPVPVEGERPYTPHFEKATPAQAAQALAFRAAGSDREALIERLDDLSVYGLYSGELGGTRDFLLRSDVLAEVDALAGVVPSGEATPIIVVDQERDYAVQWAKDGGIIVRQISDDGDGNDWSLLEDLLSPSGLSAEPCQLDALAKEANARLAVKDRKLDETRQRVRALRTTILACLSGEWDCDGAEDAMETWAEGHPAYDLAKALLDDEHKHGRVDAQSEGEDGEPPVGRPRHPVRRLPGQSASAVDALTDSVEELVRVRRERDEACDAVDQLRAEVEEAWRVLPRSRTNKPFATLAEGIGHLVGRLDARVGERDLYRARSERMLSSLDEQSDDGRTFGPYTLDEQDPGHLVVRRADGEPAEPGWYELQTMARMAWGQAALAVELFPPGRELVDGEHQRHLWLVPDALRESFPCLVAGRRWSPAVGLTVEDLTSDDAIGALFNYVPPLAEGRDDDMTEGEAEALRQAVREMVAAASGGPDQADNQCDATDRVTVKGMFGGAVERTTTERCELDAGHDGPHRTTVEGKGWRWGPDQNGDEMHCSECDGPMARNHPCRHCDPSPADQNGGGD